MRLIILLLLAVGAELASAQSRVLDSLYSALYNHPEEDSVRVNLILSICYREYTSAPEKNKTHAEEALRISREIDFKKGIGYAFRYITQYYWTAGNYAEATKYGYEMLKVFESISVLKGIGQAHQILGLINEEEGNFEKAREFRFKALQMYQKANSKIDVGYGYNSLGSLYFNFLKYDSASIYFLKGLEIRKELNDADGLSQSYGNLAHVYMSQRKFDLALEYFEKALAILEKLDNQYRIASDYAGLGEMYRLKGDFDKAESYLLKAVGIAKKIKRKRTLQKTYGQLVQLEKQRGRFERALTYSELESSYRDSIYSEDKSKQVADAEARYEGEKKEHRIQLLERDKSIQQLWKNILIVALTFVGVLSVVIYYLQRFRESKNRMILNLEIDKLTTQHKQLSAKYKDVLAGGNAQLVESGDQRLLKKAIEVVEHHMGDPLFGVEQMAKEMGMSRTNMHRKLKAITGFPPSELIRNIRLRTAAQLLLSQSDTIAQISFAVGFEDHSYFSKSFKKQFGVTPSEYFQSMRQMN